MTSSVRKDISEVSARIQEAYNNTKVGSRALNVKRGTFGKPLSVDDIKIHKRMFGSILGITEISKDVYFSMYVITLVSKFEAYIQDMVKEISKHYPVTMKSDKMISLKEVLQFNKMSLLIEHLAEITSLKSTEGTATEYMYQLGNKFGIPIHQFTDLISEVEYFVDLRHIQVHNNGVVDSQFHRKYPNAGKLGQSINLSFNLIAQMSRVFRLTANLIEVMLTKKFPKIALNLSDTDFDNFIIELGQICQGEKMSFAERID